MLPGARILKTLSPAAVSYCLPAPCTYGARMLRSLLIPMVLGLGACAHAPTPAPRPKYQVHDLTQTFWRYWDQAQGLPEAEQVRLFEEQVIAAHPDVYTAKVLSLDAEKPLREELLRRWPRFLKFVGERLPLARKLSESIGRDLPRYDARFRAAFPDFDYDGEVYFLVAVGAFDGATRRVKDRTALLFGVDVMAAVYGEDADPKSFFDHELFHIYHSPRLEPAFSATLAGALWREGLAVYVADQLNPGTPEAVLFGLPLESPARVRADLPRLAALMRSKLGSTAREDYLPFFTGSGDGQDIPARGGYTLGYLVVKELAGGRDLKTLANLDGEPLRAEIEGALERLSRRAPHP